MKSREVKTSTLIPGMVLAQDVMQSSGAYLLQKGTVLSGPAIRKLENWDIQEVLVEEPEGEHKDEIEAKLRPEMSRSHQRTVNLMERVLTKGSEDLLETEAIRGAVGEIMSQVELSKDVLLGLTHLQSYDNYLYSHSVNVCVLALIIGEGLQMSPESLKELGEAALLHDLGMLNISSDVWNQQRALTEEEFLEIRRHPDYGRELLSNADGVKPCTVEVAYQHHERFDGSGYPQGLTGEATSQFARIVAVADVYDACISPRPHRAAMTPREALNSLTAYKEKYDPKVLYAFLSMMAIYPVGCYVQLSSGETGKVVGIQRNQPFRPEIRVVTDPLGNVLDKPYRINLDNKNYLMLHITRTLEKDEVNVLLRQMGPEIAV